jgi:hypothetical protein
MRSRQRIRRSDAEWAALVAQFDASGLPATRFCEQQGIAYGTFVRRRRRAAQSTEPAESHDVAEWLPIDLTGDEDGGDSAASDTSTSTSGWDIELSLPGGVQLRMRARA